MRMVVAVMVARLEIVALPVAVTNVVVIQITAAERYKPNFCK
ncbi:MAG: hypothetical protein ACJ0G4_06580 [Alphaproteobacteria bacterium]